MSHTPGPWHVHEECTDIVNSHEGNNDYRICTTRGPDSAANARLIAAAPSLLEALQNILRSAGYESGMCESSLRAGRVLSVEIGYLDAARAIISRATGGQP